MPLEFIKSNKGNDLLKHDGYTYTRDTVTPYKTIWKCTEYCNKKGKCKGRIHTADDKVMKIVGEHNHEKLISEILAKVVVNTIKELARTATANPQEILAQSTAAIPRAVAGKLPLISLMKRTAQRSRQQVGGAPANPTRLEELVLPEEYKISEKGTPFLLYDSGADTNRILMFATPENIERLFSSPQWYADGTFKTAPPLFSQVYTIHGIFGSKVVPLVFALLANKTQQTYTMMLQQLKDRNPAVSPVAVMTDFEFAAINAFKSVFPSIENRACFFHLSQNLYRRIQGNHDLKLAYENEDDPDFALNIRMLAAIAFVPVSDVISAFEKLQDTDFYRTNEDLIAPLVDYFEDNYIGRLSRNRVTRREPLFPLTLWNCHTSIMANLPRTNNSVEAWHRKFSSFINAYHPSIWEFIRRIKQEQGMNEIQIEQLNAGNVGTSQRKQYKDTADNIRRKIEDYDANQMVLFLRGIAHNLHLQAHS